MPFILPTPNILPNPGDKTQAGNWGYILNNYLKQISFGANGGGLNTFQADPTNSPTKIPTASLSSDDTGYTYFNSKINRVRRYEHPVSGTGKWTTILEGITVWNNTTRPGGLNASMIGVTGINSETNTIEQWDGTVWNPVFKKPTSTISKAGINEFFGFEPGTAKIGTHFNTNVNGDTFYLQLPVGIVEAKVDVAKLYINPSSVGTKSFPATPTTIKILKKKFNSTATPDIVASFTVPASATNNASTVPLSSTVTTPIALGQDDQLYVEMSQDCLDVDFTIGLDILYTQV
jgi:hypothetical protein